MKPITFQTKVWELLQEYPQLEGTLASLSPAFAKLSNPVLRRTIAKVTSLQQAASIAGIEPGEMVAKLRAAAGIGITESENPEHDGDSFAQQLLTTTPQWYRKEQVSSRFDATALLDAGDVPMSHILKQSRNLTPGEIFEFTTPFLPGPVLEMLHKEGFGVWSEKLSKEGNQTEYLNRVHKF